MQRGRVVRGGVALLAVVALVAGCSPDDEEAGDKGAKGAKGGSESAEPRGGSGPSPKPSPSGDAEGAPGTFEEAVAFARDVAAGPDVYGPDFVRQSPYESGPGSVPVLDRRCDWQREPLPEQVLASLARASELPATGAGEDAKGPVKATAYVTVYDSVKSADEAMATALEDAFRCPDQRPRNGEQVTGLSSRAELGLLTDVDDQVFESGEFTSDENGGPYPYIWSVDRVGPVVFAISLKGGKGHGKAEVSTLAATALATMTTDITRRLG